MNIKLKLIALYGCTIFIMLALALVLFLNITSLNRNTAEINEAQEIVNDAEGLIISMTDQEAALRGYLATSNEEYKETYENSILTFDSKISKLEDLVADDESQLKKLDEIKGYADAWHTDAADKYLMIQKEIIDSDKVVSELNDMVESKSDKEKMDLITIEARKVIDIELQDDILYSLARMQTGLRGFILTGDESYLDPYIDGRKATVDTLNKIGSEKLRELAYDWMDNVATKQIDLKRMSLAYKTEEDLFEEMEKDVGKTNMDQIVARVAIFESYENSKLTELTDETQRKTIASIVYILIAIGLAIVAGVFVVIAVNRITGSLSKFMETLNVGSKQVASTSVQFANVGHELSEGATEQAASLEETSATMDETSSMVRQNAENTKQANELAENASVAATQGSEKVKAMNDSMDELKKSSLEISKIIKVIDDIAFQTNMLALNAAVEAARAGDAGLGFAVVAQEVRNLAQKSADAAKDTAEIIDRNIELSDQGVLISEQVSDALDEIIVKINDVNQLMDEVTSASDEQSKGIAQITQAIGQMEKIVQSNASTAEESATSASDLQLQAANLEEVVEELNKLVKGEKTLLNKGKKETVENEQEDAESQVDSEVEVDGDEQDVDKLPDEIIPLDSTDEF